VEIALTIIGVAVLIGLISMIATANRFTKVKNHIKESWADVGVVLQRRHDLIPNLVECVKGYAKYEEELFIKIAKERENAIASRLDPYRNVQDEVELGRSLGVLIARAEGYPELKASAHFLALQNELANTEDRIAAARRFYNANVREYNTLLESFPSSMIGNAFGHVRAPYFEADVAAATAPIKVGSNLNPS
jgi:LemA protein